MTNYANVPERVARCSANIRKPFRSDLTWEEPIIDKRARDSGVCATQRVGVLSITVRWGEYATKRGKDATRYLMNGISRENGTSEGPHDLNFEVDLFFHPVTRSTDKS